MKYIVQAPQISRKMAQNSGLSARLKVLNRLPNKRLVTVLDAKEFPDTSMMLFPGWLIPMKAEVEPISQEQLQPIVVKLPSDPIVEKEFRTEQEALEQLADYDGVPDLIDSGRAQVDQDSLHRGPIQWQAPYFAMRRVDGRQLYDFQLSEAGPSAHSREKVGLLATEIFPQLALRLAKVHEYGMVHRDVKPNNAMWGETKVTLLDFGRVGWLEGKARSDTGTYGFYPPELGLEVQQQEDVRTDTFGLGMTAFVLLTGHKGLLLDNMRNIWNFTGMDFMWRGRESAMEEYFEMLMEVSHLSPEQFISRTNMQPELRSTDLGRFIGQLIHPKREVRPANMHNIAMDLRRLGGQLLEHELIS